MGKRIAVLLAAAATAAVCLASLGAAEAGAVDPPGKRVKVKTVLGPAGVWTSDTGQDSSADVWFNPGWRRAGRNIKSAWIRFSAGGTAAECLYDDFDVCQPFSDFYRVDYGYGTSCTTTNPRWVPSSGENVPELQVPTAGSDRTFTVMRTMKVKFPKQQPGARRVSCEINAGISALDSDTVEYPYGYLSTGRAYLKVELFVKKK